MRKPTPKELNDAWVAFAFKVNMYRNLTMNEQGVVKSLNQIDSFVNAHSSHNGERSQKEIDDNINEAFWLYIAQQVPQPLPKRGKKDVAE